MKTRPTIIFPVAFGLVGGAMSSASVASAQNAALTRLAPPPKVNRPAPIGPTNPVVEFGAFSGTASFVDLQLPVATWNGVRADGTRVPAATSGHMGVPVGARATIGWNGSGWRTRGEVTGMQVKAVSGPKETSKSSYGRVEAAWDSAVVMTGIRGTPFFQGGVALRRAMYRNIGSGHYVDSLIPRISLGIQEWRGVGASVMGGVAARSVLGLDTGVPTESGAIPGSQSALAEYGATLSYRLSPRSRFELSAAREWTRVVISNTAAYRGLGLQVVSWDEGPREYDLITDLLMAGFRYEF